MPGRYTTNEPKSFDIALREIKKLGLPVLEYRYEPLVFGSWLISIKQEPNIRLVWDGKEYELSIQEKTKEKIHGLPHGSQSGHRLNLKMMTFYSVLINSNRWQHKKRIIGHIVTFP